MLGIFSEIRLNNKTNIFFYQFIHLFVYILGTLVVKLVGDLLYNAVYPLFFQNSSHFTFNTLNGRLFNENVNFKWVKIIQI